MSGFSDDTVTRALGDDEPTAPASLWIVSYRYRVGSGWSNERPIFGLTFTSAADALRFIDTEEAREAAKAGDKYAAHLGEFQAHEYALVPF